MITSYIRSPDAVDTGNPTDRGSYLEDAGYPAFLEWLAEATQVRGLAHRAVRFAWDRVLERVTGRTSTNLSAALHRTLGRNELSSHAVPVLGLGRRAEGAAGLRDARLVRAHDRALGRQGAPVAHRRRPVRADTVTSWAEEPDADGRCRLRPSTPLNVALIEERITVKRTPGR